MDFRLQSLLPGCPMTASLLAAADPHSNSELEPHQPQMIASNVHDGDGGEEVTAQIATQTVTPRPRSARGLQVATKSDGTAVRVGEASESEGNAVEKDSVTDAHAGGLHISSLSLMKLLIRPWKPFSSRGER